jgi:kumamolisin
LQLVLPLAVPGRGLARFAQAVSTPGSPQYGHYRSIAWLSRHFGASPSEREKVVRFLSRAGARAVHVDVTGLFVDAQLTAARAEHVFATPLLRVHATRGGAYTTPAAPIRMPRALHGLVTGVVGLDTRNVAAAPSAMHTSGYEPVSGQPSGCTSALAAGGFTPNQYLTAYGFEPLRAANQLGQGERVALIEIDGYKSSDIRTFASCFGLPAPRVTPYGVGVNRPLAPGLESTLDLEVLTAAAPGLKAVDVYESQADAPDVLMALTAPLHNSGRKPQVISVSLGLCEADELQPPVGTAGINAAQRALEMTAASGVSVLAATGDFGSTACVNQTTGQTERKLAVFYPASSQWVTAVGGTNVVLNHNNVITSQQVWNDGLVPQGAACPSGQCAAAAGGGYSKLFGRPGYQTGVVTASHRALPDVALLADIAPGYDIYCTAAADCGGAYSGWQSVGGTSVGTPLLAGGFALVDRALRAHDLQNLGAANPLLYGIGVNPSERSSVFQDVTKGSNDAFAWTSPLGCCSAAPGFDAASGWGGVNLTAFSNVALTTQPKIVDVSLSLPAQRPVHSHRILAAVSCTGACRLGAYARVSIGGRRAFTDHSRLYSLSAAGTRTVRINFSRRQLKRLRAALRHHHRISATVVGAKVDAFGNIDQSVKRSLRITH